MKRVVIIGNSGAGKSWLSARLSAKVGARDVNLDTFYWEPGGYSNKRPTEVIDNDLKQLLSEDAWVVEGVFGALVEELLEFADTLIFIDIDWTKCEESLRLRGQNVSEETNAELAKNNFQALIQWASEYYFRKSKSSHSYHRQLFEKFDGVKFHFTRREDVTSFLDTF